MDEKADEYVYMGAFNNRMKLLGMFEVSHGLCDASLLDARGVYMRALQIGASNIVDKLKKENKDWDFSVKKINVIYVPNGSGKTSLSLMFKSLCDNSSIDAKTSFGCVMF